MKKLTVLIVVIIALVSVSFADNELLYVGLNWGGADHPLYVVLNDTAVDLRAMHGRIYFSSMKFYNGSLFFVNETYMQRMDNLTHDPVTYNITSDFGGINGQSSGIYNNELYFGINDVVEIVKFTGDGFDLNVSTISFLDILDLQEYGDDLYVMGSNDHTGFYSFGKVNESWELIYNLSSITNYEFEVYNDLLFFGNGTDVGYYNGSEVFEVSSDIQSNVRHLEIYGDDLYMSTQSNNVYRYDGNSVTNASFGDVGSCVSSITGLETCDGKLYVGTNNGCIVNYDGSSWRIVAQGLNDIYAMECKNESVYETIALMYDDSVYEQEQSIYSFNITINESYYYNLSNVTAVFTFNGTEYDLVNHYNVSNVYVFETNFTLDWLLSYSPTYIINVSWNYTLNYTFAEFTNNLIEMQQTLESGIQIGACNNTVNYSILNISYYDEMTLERITATNVYDLSFYDDVNTLNPLGNFEDNYFDSFCTNLDPAVTAYNWGTWDLISLSKEDYATRVFAFPEDPYFISSNNPPYNLSLYLIGLANSSTIEYTWLSTNYELLDGTMRVYRCNENGTKTLVEITPIDSGTAFANIELVNTPYAYDVIIDGTVYEQASFSDCQIEYDTEAEYYVDFGEVTLNPVLGLFLIDCTLEEIVTDVVQMTWADNSQSAVSIMGCIVGFGQGTIGGQVETLRECSNSSIYTFNATIPSGTEYVKGEITQGSVRGWCDDIVQFEVLRPNNFAATGIIAAVLLIISMGLFFAGKGETAVIAASIGLLLSYIFGIISIGWMAASGAILFMIVIVVIGRYSRKRSQ